MRAAERGRAFGERQRARGCTICGGLDIHSYRLKPLQRITRYPLLLRAVLEHTPADHEDHGATSASLAAYRQVVDSVNEQVRSAEWTQHLRMLASRLAVPKKLQPFVLNPAGTRIATARAPESPM